MEAFSYEINDSVGLRVGSQHADSKEIVMILSLFLKFHGHNEQGRKMEPTI
jgi:hypothetical protein